MSLSSLFTNLRDYTIQTTDLQTANTIAPPQAIVSFAEFEANLDTHAYLSFSDSGMALKAILQKVYQVGEIDGFEDVKVKGDRITGIFYENLSPTLSKRFQFTASPNGIFYELVNSDSLANADFSEFGAFRYHIVEFEAKGKKRKSHNCKEGVSKPCTRQDGTVYCISKGFRCPVERETKAQKQARTVKPSAEDAATLKQIIDRGSVKQDAKVVKARLSKDKESALEAKITEAIASGATVEELQRKLKYPASKYGDAPETNPVNRIIGKMRDRGSVQVGEDGKVSSVDISRIVSENGDNQSEIKRDMQTTKQPSNSQIDASRLTQKQANDRFLEQSNPDYHGDLAEKLISKMQKHRDAEKAGIKRGIGDRLSVRDEKKLREDIDQAIISWNQADEWERKGGVLTGSMPAFMGSAFGHPDDDTIKAVLARQEQKRKGREKKQENKESKVSKPEYESENTKSYKKQIDIAERAGATQKLPRLREELARSQREDQSFVDQQKAYEARQAAKGDEQSKEKSDRTSDTPTAPTTKTPTTKTPKTVTPKSTTQYKPNPNIEKPTYTNDRTPAEVAEYRKHLDKVARSLKPSKGEIELQMEVWNDSKTRRVKQVQKVDAIVFDNGLAYHTEKDDNGKVKQHIITHVNTGMAVAKSDKGSETEAKRFAAALKDAGLDMNWRSFGDMSDSEKSVLQEFAQRQSGMKGDKLPVPDSFNASDEAKSKREVTDYARDEFIKIANENLGVSKKQATAIYDEAKRKQAIASRPKQTIDELQKEFEDRSNFQKQNEQKQTALGYSNATAESFNKAQQNVARATDSSRSRYDATEPNRANVEPSQKLSGNRADRITFDPTNSEHRQALEKYAIALGDANSADPNSWDKLNKAVTNFERVTGSKAYSWSESTTSARERQIANVKGVLEDINDPSKLGRFKSEKERKQREDREASDRYRQERETKAQTIQQKETKAKSLLKKEGLKLNKVGSQYYVSVEGRGMSGKIMDSIEDAVTHAIDMGWVSDAKNRKALDAFAKS